MSLRAKRMIKMVQDRQNENPPVNQQHQRAENGMFRLIELVKYCVVCSKYF